MMSIFHTVLFLCSFFFFCSLNFLINFCCGRRVPEYHSVFFLQQHLRHQSFCKMHVRLKKMYGSNSIIQNPWMNPSICMLLLASNFCSYEILNVLQLLNTVSLDEMQHFSREDRSFYIELRTRNGRKVHRREKIKLHGQKIVLNWLSNYSVCRFHSVLFWSVNFTYFLLNAPLKFKQINFKLSLFDSPYSPPID